MNKVSDFQEERNAISKPCYEKDGDEAIGTEARRLSLSAVLPSVLRSAIELGLIDTLHEAAAADGGAFLSPSDIALRLPSVPTNPDAPDMLNRVLRLLATCSVVECRTVRSGERRERVYRAGAVCRFLVKNGDQEGSLGSLLLLINGDFNASIRGHFTKAILEGTNVVDRAVGMSIFEYMAKDKRLAELFNKAMSDWSKFVMLNLLKVYKGFEGVNVLVDVGGGTGVSLRLIATKHSDIKAVCFDMPHVVSDAPSHPGVEYVGGDMFASVPKGDAIFLRNILHDWKDEDCLKILKNCFEALPRNGKLIVAESVLPDEPKSDVSYYNSVLEDVGMLVATLGGKQRTRTEFEALANDSGFRNCEFVCCACNTWLIEFHK